jgi:hypothetical protein
MMRRYVNQAVTTVVLAATIAGCVADSGDSDTDPQPSAAASVQYATPPEDLCDRVRFDDVLEEWGFYPPSWHEPGRDYRVNRTYWFVRCDFMGLAEDGRFETVFGEFRPRGSVAVRIHHDIAGAVEDYEMDDYNYFRRPVGSGPVSVTGWWDTGSGDHS